MVLLRAETDVDSAGRRVPRIVEVLPDGSVRKYTEIVFYSHQVCDGGTALGPDAAEYPEVIYVKDRRFRLHAYVRHADGGTTAMWTYVDCLSDEEHKLVARCCTCWNCTGETFCACSGCIGCSKGMGVEEKERHVIDVHRARRGKPLALTPNWRKDVSVWTLFGMFITVLELVKWLFWMHESVDEERDRRVIAGLRLSVVPPDRQEDLAQYAVR